MLFINICLFIIPAFFVAYFFVRKQNNANQFVFHFEPYVFKNKEYIFCKKDISHIIADILVYKIKNCQINEKLLQKNITMQYFSQNFNNFMKKRDKNRDFKFFNFIFELNKKYNNLFNFNYLIINKKIDKNIIILACKEILERGESVGIVFADESRMKNVIIAQGESVENFNVFDTYNLIRQAPTKIKRKYALKCKNLAPKIRCVEIFENYKTCNLIRVCYRNKIEYRNVFNQCLVRVHFDNVKFACQSAIVNRINLYDMFESDEVKFNNVFDGYDIKFNDARVQRIYDDMVVADTQQICADLGRLFTHEPHSKAYTYFMREIVGLHNENNALVVRPNTRLIGCDFTICDLGVAVKKRNKSCYVLDGKVFSASIPINCEDISKLDCILY